MTNPADIPQDVWDAATAVVGQPDGLGYAKVFTDRVARAILAAKAEEREAVLNLLTCHELYRYRPKAFLGFIEYVRKRGEA